jgi:hypothetical protein
MAENNFKQLEREQAEMFRNNTNRVNRNLKSNLGVFNFVGSIIDLYVTRAIGYLTDMSTDEEDDDFDRAKGNRYPNTN